MALFPTRALRSVRRPSASQTPQVTSSNPFWIALVCNEFLFIFTAFALLLLFQYYPLDGKVRALLPRHNVTVATGAFAFEWKIFFWLINISFSYSVTHTQSWSCLPSLWLFWGQQTGILISVKEYACCCRSANKLGLGHDLNLPVLFS